MLHNPQRLPLVINIGLMAMQASVQSHLDKKSPTLVNEDYSLADDLWDSVRAAVVDLAEMDHQSGFYPKVSPLLFEFGLLQEYWKIRDHLDPKHPAYQWC